MGPVTRRPVDEFDCAHVPPAMHRNWFSPRKTKELKFEFEIIQTEPNNERKERRRSKEKKTKKTKQKKEGGEKKNGGPRGCPPLHCKHKLSKIKKNKIKEEKTWVQRGPLRHRYKLAKRKPHGLAITRKRKGNKEEHKTGAQESDHLSASDTNLPKKDVLQITNSTSMMAWIIWNLHIPLWRCDCSHSLEWSFETLNAHKLPKVALARIPWCRQNLGF